MARRLSTAVAAICLVLIVPIVLMWTRSYRQWDILGSLQTIPSGQMQFNTVESVKGRIMIGAVRNAPRNFPRWPQDGRLLHTRDASTVTFYERTRLERMGFDFKRFTSRRTGAGEWHLTIPWWFITLLDSAIAGLALAYRLRRKKLHGSGACRACGYDLRATPDRCPECGTAVGPRFVRGGRDKSSR
ncbi:MAG TPA: hypothetical protein VG269_04025 [Tepidisphaeraceae bacterium]|nr:hypothetical protein [Tepidisphaeraceae bacterium]